VTVNSSNLFDNGFLAGGRINLDVDIFLSPLPLISANGDFWGVLGPRDDETATANITNVQYSPRPVTNSLYGEVALLPPLQTLIYIENRHLNYKIEIDTEHTAKYERCVYSATSVWNGYKPGVIREGIEGDDDIIVPIKAYPIQTYEPDIGPIWVKAGPGNKMLNTQEIGIIPSYFDDNGYSESLIVSAIAHEFGHFLGLDQHNGTSDVNVMTGWVMGSQGLYFPVGGLSYVPLTKNDTASYDAAYRLY